MQVVGITFGPPLPIAMLARAVQAGFPSPADDFIEDEVDLQRLLVSNRPATFLVRVAGDSMVGKGLFDGDLAIVDRSLTPRNGDVVVVDIDGDRSFKVWHRQAHLVTLAFANVRYPAFQMPAGASVEVWGVVSSSIHPQRQPARQ